MTLDEFLRVVVDFYAERRLSRPVRLRVDSENPGDSMDTTLNPGLFVSEPAPRAKQKPAEDDTPSTAVDALRIAIFHAGQRQTGGQLAEFVTDRWGKWRQESLVSMASEEAKRPDGRIKYHLKDPGDGYGKGYGLSEWEP